MSAELEADAVERERRVAVARSQLKNYPQSVRVQFDRMLEIAQIAAVIHNDHAYWLDCSCVYDVRRVMLAFGRRFVNTNILDVPEEVMHLSLAEIKQIGAILAQGQLPNGQQALVSERKAELA